MTDKFFVTDAHCHIYPEKIAARAIAGTDGFYHEHSVGKGTADALLRSASPGRVDRFIVQSVATTPHQVKSINEFIAGEVKKHPDKFVGLGTLHPDSADIKGDTEHLLALGLKGVKLHPDIQGFKIDDYRCLKIYELCEENRLPILSRKLCGTPNLYVDCSSSLPYLKRETAREIIRRYGAERVLFGSDYPMRSPESELDAFLSLGLTDDENEMILNKNACKIFNLE